MIVCPLCEHSQPGGDACDVCGRPLEGPGARPAPVAALDGLEPTAHADAGDPVAPRLEDLEATALEPAALAASEPLAELEPTGAAPAEVEVVPAPDLEPTALAAPGDGPAPTPAEVVCRYCRTPARRGERRCARCGMRLPVLAAPAEGSGAALDAARRCSCGAPVTGALCPACGARRAGSLEG